MVVRQLDELPNCFDPFWAALFFSGTELGVDFEIDSYSAIWYSSSSKNVDLV